MSVSSKGNVAISVSPGSTGTGSDELALTTNCSSGYVVYASATSSSASTSLSNGSSEISASSNTLASPGTLSDNTWGIANASNYAEGKFAGLPTYANMATTSLTSGNSAVSATKIPVYYGVKVNSSIAPGTYTGNVLYTAMVNSACYTYTISYDANGGSGTMNDQELPTNTETALSSNSFTRDGYSFLGWSEDKDAKVATFTDAQSVTGETFGITENGSNVTLYAIWEEDTVVEMQNWLGCGKLAANEVVTLLDVRNNVKYKVKKIINESTSYAQCWMVENLRYMGSTGTDPAETSVTSGTFTTDSNSQTSGTSISAVTTFSTSGNTTIQARYDGNKTYGAYYSWTAAKSVCPVGWHLPTGGSSGEFSQLDIALGGTGANRSNANAYSTFTGTDLTSGQNMAFPLAGFYNGSSLGNTELYGFYWSSDQVNISSGYRLDLLSDDSSVYPRNNHYKYRGNSVRCVADQTAEIDGIMQNWTGCDSLADNEIVSLLDTRNNVIYKVKRVVAVSGSATPDYAECWMVENLRLTPGTTDPGTTQVVSGTLTTTTDASQAAGSITFASSGFNNSTAGDTGLRAVYKGNTTYGAYYTWPAAKVVCPAGWHLPSGGSGGEFSDLDIALGGTGANRANANTYTPFTNPIDDATTPGLGLALAGYYSSSSLYSDGSRGYYWTSTANSSRGHYLYLYSDNSDVSPQGNNYKYSGLSVRCVAGGDPTTMQGFNASKQLPNVGDKATLTDIRDNSTYTVERLADGKCWMTQNLRIVNKTLDSSTSNISSDSSNYSYKFTIPASSLNGFTKDNETAADKRAAYYNNDTTYGAYYNFYTATAGYSYYDDGKTYAKDGSAPFDICPKGWRLPTGGPDSEFVALDKAMNTHDAKAGTNRKADTSGAVAADVQKSFQNMIIPTAGTKTDGYPGFALAGSVYSGSLGNTDTSGSYWPSTVFGTSYGYYLYLGSSNSLVYPQIYNYKYYGYSVRCVAQ